jgi:vacuolar-type H+-ATPase subunit F/Vma7
MTVRVAYVGNEASAAGYRLAGVRPYLPAAGDVGPALDQACAESDVVLLSAACARRLPAVRVESLARQVAPLLLVVPDAPLEDIGARLQRELGLEP